MTKKLMKLLISLCLCTTLALCAVGFTACGGDEYVLNEDGQSYTFAKYNGGTGITIDDFPDAFEIPSEYKGKPVTKIASSAFPTSLKTLIIPDSITVIEDGAFVQDDFIYNEYDNAYYLGNTENPYMVLIKAKSNDITSCKINENTKIIYGERGHLKGLGQCTKLDSIIIPDSVIYIGTFAFGDGIRIHIGENNKNYSYCSGYAWTTISDNIHSSYTSYEHVANIICNKEKTEIISVSHTGKLYAQSPLELPDTTIKIGDYAFYNYDDSVKVPASVTSIGKNAFYSSYQAREIIFDGTKAQWDAISKDEEWCGSERTQISCTDGTVKV
jgi:hypothetical protein